MAAMNVSLSSNISSSDWTNAWSRLDDYLRALRSGCPDRPLVTAACLLDQAEAQITAKGEKVSVDLLLEFAFVALDDLLQSSGGRAGGLQIAMPENPASNATEHGEFLQGQLPIKPALNLASMVPERDWHGGLPAGKAVPSQQRIS